MAVKILTIVGAVVGFFAMVMACAMYRVASWSGRQLHSIYEEENDEAV